MERAKKKLHEIKSLDSVKVTESNQIHEIQPNTPKSNRIHLVTEVDESMN